MRTFTLLAIISLCAGSASAGEIWKFNEGVCGEWTGTWHLDLKNRAFQPSTHYWFDGEYYQTQTGGTCAKESGQQLNGSFSGTLNAETGAFTLEHKTGLNKCRYRATISAGSNIFSGTYTCEKNGGPFKFTAER